MSKLVFDASGKCYDGKYMTDYNEKTDDETYYLECKALETGKKYRIKIEEVKKR